MILKLQQGGNALPPLVSYQPVTVTGRATAEPTAESNGEVSDLTDKDLLDMMEKLNGLPSDIELLTNSLQNFYIDQQFSPFPNTSNIASKYMQILSQLKVANFNKEQFDKALEIVTKNGGLNEFAINDRGQLFCINSEGDFKLMSIDELEGSDYQPLTNSELLQQRAYSPSQAFRNDILKVVSNGIGMEAINKQIQDVISKLGKSEFGTEGYTTKQASQVLGGIEILNSAIQQGALDSGLTNLSVDGLYKSKIITSSQAAQAENALSYIYHTLPENARTLLKLKSGGTDEGVKALLTQLVTSSTSSKFDFNLDLQKSSTSSKDSSGTKDTTPEMSLAENIQRGGGTPVAMPFKYGTMDTMITDARMYPVTKKNGESIGGNVTLQKFTEDSQITGLYDLTQVTFGDQIIPTSGIKDILVEDPTIYHAYLPIDQDQASKGIITPDLKSVARLETAKEKLKELGIESVENVKTPQEIEAVNQVYAELKLPPVKLEDGKFTQYYRQFGILQGDAFSNAFSDPDAVILGDSPMLHNVEEENIAQGIFDLIKGPNSKEKYDHRGAFDMHIWGKPNYQSIFKGLIFLPLKTTDRNYGKMVAGNDITEKEAIENQMKYQQEQRLKSTTIVRGQL